MSKDSHTSTRFGFGLNSQAGSSTSTRASPGPAQPSPAETVPFPFRQRAAELCAREVADMILISVTHLSHHVRPGAAYTFFYCCSAAQSLTWHHHPSHRLWVWGSAMLPAPACMAMA